MKLSPIIGRTQQDNLFAKKREDIANNKSNN